MSRIALECRLLKCVGVSGARISSADPTAQLHRIFPFEFALPGFQLGCRALKWPKRKALLLSGRLFSDRVPFPAQFSGANGRPIRSHKWCDCFTAESSLCRRSNRSCSAHF
ncbi:hypothetical protein TNCV_2108871 [Trichonephila clavipes]|nr:hypothetical protein TNCV_2108871 [Trichonephila clavipes]